MPQESSISVITAATDRNLLTIAQLRAAVDVTGSAYDAKLTELGLRISDLFAKVCRVEEDGVNPPTLLAETVKETWRKQSYWMQGAWPFADSEVKRSALYCKRFPVTSVTSVVSDGTTLTEGTDFELRKADGAIVRLSGGQPTILYSWKIEATYVAGRATVPSDLALAAAQMAQVLWWQSGRDPNEKSNQVDGLGKSERFGHAFSEGAVPSSIMDMLEAGGYVNRFTG